ncbi:uncharacterized protein LOC131858596 [Cryptomeria japonica]|uniref:uncharacterized protein LOC131858596 n=1 Tax=Cryptomeria japonica TaxID=3369 RepID=UPI0027DA34B2|nr:uncharacterized protein LOC131858596 [Cryptomeria japonica]
MDGSSTTTSPVGHTTSGSVGPSAGAIPSGSTGPHVSAGGGGGAHCSPPPPSPPANHVDSGEEDVDISGETASMSSSDRSDSEGDESALGSQRSDGDEGGDSGHDVEMPQDMESRGAERADEEGLIDRVRSLEDLVATLRQ